ncbi:MAG TPA: FAD-dependent oxidoreductase [Ktedonobacterales bacterium]|nr:FAD-dependent oxidoreductase [Ktedonobacterales bacterium]
MARYQYDVTVLGGGSGGLTAARLAAALGARTALIDKECLGGDCLYYGCVPSKTLIHVARVVSLAKASLDLGLASADLKVDMARISAHVQRVIERVSEVEQVYVKDVSVRFGHATFRSEHEIDVDGDILSSKRLIIATGSRPRVPPVEGLQEVGYLTNEDVFDLRHLPPSLIVVGGGPVGVELAQAFARLGSQVTLIQGPGRVLPKEDPEVSDAIAQALARDRVNLELGARMVRVSRRDEKKVVVAQRGDSVFSVEADAILLAVGRSPNVEGLNLEAAGVAYDQKGIKTDAYLQTSASTISAIGDVIGGYLFTHVAAYQAGIAVRNALVPVGRKKVNYRVLPWATFTDPEAARVGLTEEEARGQGQQIRVVRFPWSEIDRAQTEGEREGFIKIILSQKGDKMLGAHLVGGRAGELLGELALAMRHHLGLPAILATIHAYPTLSSGVQQTAFEAYLESPALRNARKFIRFLLALRG